MTIDGVHITNWQPPGEPWWEEVKSKPEEPLIQATVSMTLSWDEYQALLSQNQPRPG